MSSSGCPKNVVLLSAFLVLVVGEVACSHNEAEKFFNILCDPYQSNISENGCRSDSLETIAAKVEADSSVQIEIGLPLLHLNALVNFANLSSLTINGQPDMTEIVCPSHSNMSVGIVLHDIKQTVSLKNLKLTFCGAEVQNMFEDDLSFTSALSLLYCMNIEIDRLVITKSKGVGLTILNHRGGTVIVTSTALTENQQPREYIGKSLLGGGGLNLQLGRYQSNQYLNMTFSFENCTFENNVQHIKQYNFLFTNAEGEVQKGSGRGGGVHMYIRTGVSDVHVSFLDCKFIANKAFVGGGIASKISAGTLDRKTANITVLIKDSLFEHNGCSDTQRTGFGGGIYLTFSSYLYALTITNSHYIMENVHFNENCATIGGGVFYSSYHRKTEFGSLADNSMLFDNCTFEKNKAHIGSAVLVIPNTFMKSSTGQTVNPTFENCQFLENLVFTTSSSKHRAQVSAGVGTVYSTQTNIQFQGYNVFCHNWGSPVYMVNGVVNMTHSSVRFYNNTALDGGAVALIGSSTMIVGPNDYEFIKNRALHYGGALHVLLIDSTDFSISRSCFIQYSDNNNDFLSNKWNANVTFLGNRAKDCTAGHAIYATTLYPCQVTRNGTVEQPTYTFIRVEDVFLARGVTFDNDTALQPQMATDGTLFHSTKPTLLMVIPGEMYEHGVTVLDDLHQEINSSFRATINKAANFVRLNSDFSRFVGGSIQLSGKPHKTGSLYLQTISPRQTYIQLDVHLVDCPPGFKLNENSKCVCNVDAYVGLFKCQIERLHCHLVPGYWAGLVPLASNESQLVTSQCPFCDYTLDSSGFAVSLPQSYSQLSRAVCGETRTGVVCGMCTDNYTVHFHSPGFLCKPAEPVGCKLGWLFYILSELLPVTVLFIIVLVFNISFTSGAVNGFILFSQMLASLDIDASGVINYPESARKSIKGWTQGYRVMYGFFNLEFFNSDSLSFCMKRGASALDMLAVKYITIIYALFLIAVVIWIINKFGGKCCGKFCRITTVKTSVIHGVSTFLIICYAQCVKVSLKLLVPVYFYMEESSSFQPPPSVWLNGELKYFSTEHLPYAIPALIFLLTIGLIPPLLLLSYPLLNKVITFIGCENSKIVNFISRLLPINYLKPILDSFQGCFKDNMRFFAGMYFLYRWLILLIDISASGFSTYYTSIVTVLVAMLVIHAVCQPYVNRMYNILDSLLFCNLIIINALSFFNYFRSFVQRRLRQGVTILPAVVQLILIYLPLALMYLYLITLFLKNVLNYCGCKIPCKHFFHSKKSNVLLKLSQIYANDSNSSDEEFSHSRIDDEELDYTSRCAYVSNGIDSESTQSNISTY